MIEIKRLNETAVAVFTDTEEEADKIMEKIKNENLGNQPKH